jgi:hypothetical protein
MSKPHNLDIQSYSFYEILDLFQLEADNVTMEHLKRAKKKVLMMHPDKSNLPKEYFLFYKKAFDVVVRMYENVQKVSQRVEETGYFPHETETDDVVSKQFQKTIGKISQKTFQHNFNELFDKHMKKPPTNPQKNDWFTRTDALYSEQAASSGEMGSVLERIKEQQQSLTKYTGVVSMQYVSQGNSFYDDDDDDHNEDANNYKCSDPFSKLKYDDLRKVHKDQTVFSVRDSDLRNVPQYKTVDEYEQARDVRSLTPMERSKAQQMLQEQDAFLQEKILQKQYQSELVTMRNVDANKQVMSNFLRLH